ncbi:hypothetical protein BC332_27870 [Capsicum chinense]|nr:hypothetical protein BC332_27870 [Capsicum chinense]
MDYSFTAISWLYAAKDILLGATDVWLIIISNRLIIRCNRWPPRHATIAVVYWNLDNWELGIFRDAPPSWCPFGMSFWPSPQPAIIAEAHWKLQNMKWGSFMTRHDCGASLESDNCDFCLLRDALRVQVTHCQLKNAITSQPSVGFGRIWDCGLFIAAYVEYLSDGLQVLNVGLDAGLLHKRYAALLWKYREVKAQKLYASNIKDPRRPKPNSIALDEEHLVHIE